MHSRAVIIILFIVITTICRSTAASMRHNFNGMKGMNSIQSKTSTSVVDDHSARDTEHTSKTVSKAFDETSRNNKRRENADLSENSFFTKNGKYGHASDAAISSASKKYKKDIYEKEQRALEDVMESRFKQLLGADDISLPVERQSKRHKPSRYIQELFAAMLYDDEQSAEATQPGAELVIPTIRSYRSAKVKNHNRPGQAFNYDVSETSTDIRRVEMVIEILWNINLTSFSLAVSSETNGTLVELLTVKADVHSNYLIFDITSISDKLIGVFRLILRLSASGEHLRISRRNSPLLIVYENMSFNPLLRHARRKKRNAALNYNYLIDEVSSTGDDVYDSFNCKRYDWEIDMDIFQWDWYIAPRFYNAGFCYGDCPFPLDSPVMNSTTYSFIKNLYHYKTALQNENVPRACCTPISYYSQTILYFNQLRNSVLKKLPNMRVATCGCR